MGLPMACLNQLLIPKISLVERKMLEMAPFAFSLPHLLLRFPSSPLFNVNQTALDIETEWNCTCTLSLAVCDFLLASLHCLRFIQVQR